jgi:hypothetical protein
VQRRASCIGPPSRVSGDLAGALSGRTLIAPQRHFLTIPTVKPQLRLDTGFSSSTSRSAVKLLTYGIIRYWIIPDISHISIARLTTIRLESVDRREGRAAMRADNWT